MSRTLDRAKGLYEDPHPASRATFSRKLEKAFFEAVAKIGAT
jgi:hypothetical protein